MRALALLALSLLASPAAAHGGWGRGIAGDGKPTTERREVPPFEAVRLEAPVDVSVAVGPDASVAVTIDGNLQAHLETRVERGTLVIDLREAVRPRREARVEISVPALRRFEVAGSGDAVVTGGSGPIELSVEGSGDLAWRGEATTLRAELEGSGDIRLEGRADSLVADVEGSGDVDARGLAAADVRARVEGSGDMELRVAGGRLDAAVEGSGDIRWRGEARQEQIVVRGSGDVRRAR